MRNIDMIALLASIVMSMAITLKTIRKSQIALRPVFVFLMVFAPATIFVHMAFHIGQINFYTIENIKKGLFKYDFRYYSLMLMAVVLIYCAALLIQGIKRSLEDEGSKYMVRPMATIVLVSAPTIPFTPIGVLPILACFVTLVALPFSKKKQNQDTTRKYPRAATNADKNLKAIEALKFV